MNNLFLVTFLVGVLFGASCYALPILCYGCNCCPYENDYGYLPDRYTRCIYYMCQRVGGPRAYTYYTTPMECAVGTLWDQSLLTCVHDTLGECESNMTVPTPVEEECYLSAIPGDDTMYRDDTTGLAMSCAGGTVWNQEICGCEHGYNPTTCVPELYFSYNEDFNSDSCSEQAVSVQVGTSLATLEWDAKSWKSAYFDGNDVLLVPFMANYFANNNVQAFTVALWFKWTSPTQFLQGLVYQSACQGLPSFGIHVGSGSYLGAFLGTDDCGFVWPDTFPIQQGDWTHVAIVYDGINFNVYINGGDSSLVSGASMSSTPINGAIINSHCSMVVGQAGYEGSGIFIGYIDELHVYMETALTQAGVQTLM